MKNLLGKSLLLPFMLGACLSMALAQSDSTVRIEQDDPSIVYTGNWYSNGSSVNSGGTAALTNAIRATATLSFTGTGVTWIGVLDPWSGFATAFVDGTMYVVDTYGSTTLYQRPLFSVQGLPPGPHTLTIEVMHTRDGNGLGSWVWIDAFDVENGSGIAGGFDALPGRSEQQNAACLYTGTWFTHKHTMHSGGSSALSVDPGSSVTISFSGTGISWIAYSDEWSGIAKVILDGKFEAQVDTYASPAKAQATVFTVDNLLPGNHTLTIEVTGKHSPDSHGSWIWVDAFDITGP